MCALPSKPAAPARAARETPARAVLAKAVPVPATPVPWAAGVLPVAVSSDRVPVVLLGLDARFKGGKWSDFAGGGEPEDESPRHTALRELGEETGGVVTMGLDDLDRATEFLDVTPSGKRIHRYLVVVPFDDALPGRFAGSKGNEKTKLGWFSLHDLPAMRPVFAKQMTRDRDAILATLTALDPTPRK